MSNGQSQSVRLPVTTVIISLCTIVVAITLFSGNTLKNTVFSGSHFSMSVVLWYVLAGFFSVVSISCILSLIGRIILELSSSSGNYWQRFTFRMLYFSLYMLINWIILWGVPFVVTMGAFSRTEASLGKTYAIVVSALTMIATFLFMVMAIPRDERRRVFPWGPFYRATKIQAFLLGITYVNTQYILDIKTSKRIYASSETLELCVILKGTVLNHDKLAATISPLNNKHPLTHLKFQNFGEGEYFSWKKLENLSPGLYQGEVFFRNYRDANPLKKLSLRFSGNNHQHRRFKFFIS